MYKCRYVAETLRREIKKSRCYEDTMTRMKEAVRDFAKFFCLILNRNQLSDSNEAFDRALLFFSFSHSFMFVKLTPN